MALKFWVGGTGTWDGSSTTHWASTSGGAPGVAAPTTADVVTFDANSGGGLITIDPLDTAKCQTLVTAGFGGTFQGTGAVECSRQWDCSGGTWTWSGTLNLTGLIGITLISFSTRAFSINVNLGAGSVRADMNNLNTTGSITMTQGIIRFINDATIFSMSFTGSATKVLDLNGKTLTLTSDTTMFDASGTGNLVQPSGGTIVLRLFGATHVFKGGGLSFETLAVTMLTSGSRTVQIEGANIISNFTVTQAAGSVITVKWKESTTQTIDAVTISAATGERVLFRSALDGTQYTFNKTTSSLRIRQVDLKDCIGNGGAVFIAQKSKNSGNNNNWAFTTPGIFF